MKDHLYCVYIVTNKYNTVLYTGVTNNIQRRIIEHKNKRNSGFSAHYNCNKLVYVEYFQWIYDAISREKQIKGGSRRKKIDLVNLLNPDWSDLALTLSSRYRTM